jgi:hypothetical protein
VFGRPPPPRRTRAAERARATVPPGPSPRSPRAVRMPDGREEVVGCLESCLNRAMRIHCDARTCPCGPACANRPFHALEGAVRARGACGVPPLGGREGPGPRWREGFDGGAPWACSGKGGGAKCVVRICLRPSPHPPPLTPLLPQTQRAPPPPPPQPVEVFLASDGRGHGLRAAAPLRRGDLVGEYAGEVVDAPEARRRAAAASAAGRRHCYAMRLGPGLYIDAERRGGLARLMNSGCEPNCEAQKWCGARARGGGWGGGVLASCGCLSRRAERCRRGPVGPAVGQGWRVDRVTKRPPARSLTNPRAFPHPPPKGTTPRRARRASGCLPFATSRPARR